jgi:hypothetical protein
MFKVGKWMGKIALPLLLIFCLTGITYASYGDGLYGDVIYGDSGGVAIIEGELALSLSSTLANSNIATTTNLLNLLASASQSHTYTVVFVRELALTAVAQMSNTTQLNGVSILVLNQTIFQSNINLVNVTSLLVLASQVSQAGTTGGTWDVGVTLSAISTLLLDRSPVMNPSLSLTAQANISEVSGMTMNSIASLIAQGSISEAVQLLANASNVLNAYGSVTESSKVDWIKVLGLGMTAQDVYGISGTSYDSSIDFALAAGIAYWGGIRFESAVELSATAKIENIIASMLYEGIVTLNSRGSFEFATQLAYYGSVILNGIATQTLAFGQNLTVTMVLNAISTAVVNSDIGTIAEIAGRRIFIKDTGQRGFIKDTGRRILHVD